MRNEVHQDIEDEINTGEIELLIDQARDELKLIPLMAGARSRAEWTGMGRSIFLALYPLARHPEGCGIFPGVRTAT